MLSFWPRLQNRYTNFFYIPGKFLHETCRLSPDQVSLVSLFFGLATAWMLGERNLSAAFIFLFLSLIFDALDGTIARQYQLETERGFIIDLLFDRLAEAAIFSALIAAGYVAWQLALGTYTIILVMTGLMLRTKVDLGGRRMMLFLAPMLGFTFVFYAIIMIQLLAIGLSLARFNVKI